MYEGRLAFIMTNADGSIRVKIGLEFDEAEARETKVKIASYADTLEQDMKKQAKGIAPKLDTSAAHKLSSDFANDFYNSLSRKMKSKKVSAVAGKGIDVPVNVNTEKVKQDLNEIHKLNEDFAKDLADTLFANAKKKMVVPVDADTTKAQEKIEQLDDTTVTVNVDSSGNGGGGASLSGLAQGAGQLLGGGGSGGSSALSSMLGGGGGSGALAALGEIGVVLGAVTIAIKAIKKIFEVIVKIVKGLIKLGQFARENVVKALKGIKQIASVTLKIAKGIGTAAKGFLDFSHNALGALGITEKIKDSLDGIGFGDLVNANLLSDLIESALSKIKEFTEGSIESASDFQTYYRRIRDIFGDSKDVIYDYAKSSAENLGMSESAFLEYSSQAATFAKSFIPNVEDLSNVTIGLTTAVADLSAETGYSLDDTMSKVIDGLRGNTEAMEELGVSISSTNIEKWLNTQGISVKLDDLDESMQKLYRTWYLVDNLASSNTMGYASKMMNSYSGQLSILNAQLSDLQTTLGTYLMQALVPVLQLANMLLARLVDIVNVIGSTFGLLSKYDFAGAMGTGEVKDGISDVYDNAKKSIVGATDAQKKLTKEVGNTASAANKSLAPFHKLNVLQKQKGGGGASGKSPAVGITGVSLADTKKTLSESSKMLAKWIADIKKAIAEGKWEEVGKIIASKLNSLIAKINLTEASKKTKEGMRSLARIINGFVKELDFSQLGSKVSDMVNLVVSAINTFVETTAWANAGRKLADFSRSLLTDIDWEGVGELWTSGTNILIKTLSGFVDKMSEIDPETGKTGFVELGDAIGNFFNGVLSLDWTTLGTTVGTGISGMLETITASLGKIDVISFAKSFAQGINNAVSNIDSGKFSDAASSIINAIMKALDIILQDTDFKELGTKVGESIIKTLNKIDWDEVSATVYRLLTGALDFTKGINDSLNEADADGESAASKLKEGIAKLFDTVTVWLQQNKDDVVENINGIISTIFDIFADQDWYSLGNELKKILSDINWDEFFGIINLPEILSTALDFDTGTSVVDSLGQSIMEVIWNGITSATGWLFGKIKDFILGEDGVLSYISKLLIGAPINHDMELAGNEAIASWIAGQDSKKGEAEESAGAIAAGIYNGFSISLFGEDGEAFSNMGVQASDDLGTGILSGKDKLVENANTITTDVLSSFDSLNTGVKTRADDVGKNIENMVNGAQKGATTLLDTMKKVREIQSPVANLTGVTFPEWKFPKLAKGAVIRPNQRFLAELGDQTSGINIETPLNTMLDAFRTSLNERGYGDSQPVEVSVYIGDELIDDYIVKANQRATFRSNGK